MVYGGQRRRRVLLLRPGRAARRAGRRPAAAPGTPVRCRPSRNFRTRAVTDRAEPAERQTARHLIAAVVGEARAGAVLDALDTSQPGRLARLARILTADQLRALAGQPPPALDGAAAPAVTLTAEQAALV